jgi:RNA polymerase sigma factor (sigma-70 family)
VPEPKLFVIDGDRPFWLSISALADSMGLGSQVFPSAEDYLSQFDPDLPGCLILELSLPGMSGLDLQERLARLPIAPPMILVTAHADLPATLRAKRLGAIDVLQKQAFSENDLWESIQSAIAHDRQNRGLLARRNAMQASLAQLTEPERKVLELLLSGKSNQNIADELGISRRAVESRRARVMRKLAVATLPDLVRFGIDAGLYQSLDLLRAD